MSHRAVGGPLGFTGTMSMQRSTEQEVTPRKSATKPAKSTVGGPSPARSPYPYNRHAEVCSLHCGSHTKNQASPVTRARLAPQTAAQARVSPQKPARVSPQKKAGSPLQSPAKAERQPLAERQGWPSEANEQAALAEFENFLQDSGHNSVENSFAQFDSFSQKKAAPRDALEEALRESEQLSLFLEGSTRPSKPVRDNIFKD